MRSRKDPDVDYFDAFNGEPTSSWLYANWGPLYVPRIDGSLAWIYHCPLMRSPPHVMNQCYDKIPIFYKNAIFFVDPITR